MTPDEMAFKDFPNAVSNKELEAVLTLCKNQYEKVKMVIDQREIFLENTRTKFSQAESDGADDQVKRGLQKLVDALIDKADREFLKLARKDLGDIYEVTEFLARFTQVDEYPQLDISFLNNIEKRLDNGTI